MAFKLCCSCGQNDITIRRYNTSTGETVWEYGPGQGWTWHYGSDLITGWYVPKATVLTRRVQAVGTSWTRSGLTANGAEAVHFVTIDADDGSVVSDTEIPGLFATGTTKGRYTPQFAMSLHGLSGGNIVAGQSRVPIIELVDFTSNTATKKYILHQHGQTLGNVTLRTVGNVDCVFSCTASNATIEAAVDALTEVTSVTVSGGPWPLSPVTIDIVWSSASGDFKTFSTESTSGGISTGISAIYYERTTGEILSAVGAQFGFGTGVTPTKLISVGTASAPAPGTAPSTVTGPLRAVADNKVLMGTMTRTTALECWTVGTSWSRNWVVWLNSPSTWSLTCGLSNVEENTVCVTHGMTISEAGSGYTTSGYWGEKIDCGSGTVTSFDRGWDGGSDINFLGWYGTPGAVLTDTDSSSVVLQYSRLGWDAVEDWNDIVSEGYDDSIGFPLTDGASIALDEIAVTDLPFTDSTHQSLFARWADGVGTLYGCSGSALLGTRSLGGVNGVTNSRIGRNYARKQEVVSEPLNGSYYRYWWQYQVEDAIRATAGEFRMKLKWVNSPESFIYTDWLDYLTTTEDELKTALTDIVGPPGSTWVDGVNFPLVEVGNILQSSSAVTNTADRTHYGILERGVTVVFTVDRTTLGDRFIHSSKQFVFTSSANITFEFRNMTWDPYSDAAVCLYDRDYTAAPIWGRTWRARSGAPSAPAGSWFKNGKIVHFDQESRAEL